MDEHTRIDPTGPSAGWRASRLTVALAGAGGFLAGVLLVAILGGTPTLTETTTQRVTVTTAASAPTTVDPGTIITKTQVPDLVGQRLDVAKQRLDDAQFDADVSGGGLFGVIDDSNWVVVAQDPPAGTEYQQGSRVQVEIERG